MAERVRVEPTGQASIEGEPDVPYDDLLERLLTPLPVRRVQLAVTDPRAFLRLITVN